MLGVSVDRWLSRIERTGQPSRLFNFTSPLLAALGTTVFIASVVALFIVKPLQPWMRFVVPSAGLTLAAGCFVQYMQLRRGFVAKSMATLIATVCCAYALLTPVGFEIWYQKTFADVQAIAKSLANSDGQVAQYNDYMLSLLFYRKGPIDFFYRPEYIVPRATCALATTADIHSPLLVIVKNDRVSDIINRTDVHFTIKQRRGNWSLYESTDAVLRPSPTLQWMFERQSMDDMLADKMHAGPLTMPYSGGSWTFRRASNTTGQ